MVQLYLNGKRKSDIIREYDISQTVFDRWIKQHQKTRSFKEKDNISPEKTELIELCKRLKQLEMENDILKQAADNGTKVDVILANQDKYSILALYAVLQLPRNTFYYEAKVKTSDSELKDSIKEIFKASRSYYGTREIKQELAKKDKLVSRRKTG